jgi:hypothetical protein
VIGAGSAGLAADQDPVPLHPAVGDTLEAAEAERFGLFGDVDGLESAVFFPAPWGGYLARLQLAPARETVWRERNVPSQTWRSWQTRIEGILAGTTVPEATGETPGDPGVAAAAVADPAADPPAVNEEPPPSGPFVSPDAVAADSAAVVLPGHRARIKVWPEVPLPPQRARVVRADSVLLGYPELSGRWFVLLEGGYRRNISDFSNYFTDMGVLALTWGRMFGRLMPFFAMEVGFGDIDDDFEAISGDGRSNVYNFALGLLARQPISRSLQLYGSGAFGYFIRSLQWSPLSPIEFGAFPNGFVLEQQDFGGAFRFGLLWQRKTAAKPRFFDIGVGLQTTPADEWAFKGPEDDSPIRIRAADRDTWITVSIRYGDSL